ncbi:hypothetical protein HK097_000869 [Rhizophlyctis rosea]|uniref:Uncharacterized protein n=1 Tax=Rhizophlyctis rosea TaxID=64517 RepID=A0AAD5S532_9FUNG|nr:hypothetical protein HK097_000869 [Rhizophlyctis rosea]
MKVPFLTFTTTKILFETGRLEGGYKSIYEECLHDPTVHKRMFKALTAQAVITACHSAIGCLRCYYRDCDENIEKDKFKWLHKICRYQKSHFIPSARDEFQQYHHKEQLVQAAVTVDTADGLQSEHDERERKRRRTEAGHISMNGSGSSRGQTSDVSAEEAAASTLMTIGNHAPAQGPNKTQARTEELEHFISRYHLIVDIPQMHFHHKSKTLHVDLHDVCLQTFDDERDAEMVGVRKKYTNSRYHSCLQQLHLVKAEVGQCVSGGSSTSDHDSDDEAEHVQQSDIPTALQESYAAGLKSMEHGSVHTIADKCYRMFTSDHKHNFIISSDTTELEYRSAIVDVIFAEIFQSRWMTYRPGEQHNTLMAMDRAVQQEDENARGPLHDGIGWVSFDTVKIPLLLVEVVAGPAMRDAAKERTDCEKLLKSLATSVSVQAEMGGDVDGEVKKHLKAFGLLVYQTTVRVLEARYVNEHFVVKQVDFARIPGSIQHWRELGRLLECLVQVKYLLKKGYDALKTIVKPHASLPSAAVSVTPAKGLKRKGAGIRKTGKAKEENDDV